MLYLCVPRSTVKHKHAAQYNFCLRKKIEREESEERKEKNPLNGK